MSSERPTGEAAGAGADFWQRHGRGPLAFLFTDIVGSTRLKEILGEEAGVARIQAHHAMVRLLLRGFEDAAEVRTSGDSFLIVFARASDAVAFALTLQRELRERAAHEEPRVSDRIGIHHGEALIQEGHGFKELLGSDVDVCARLTDLGTADQILLSREAQAEARKDFEARWTAWAPRIQWLHHGGYFLEGVSGAREIWEVGETGLARLRPPWAPWHSRRGRATLVAAGVMALGVVLLGGPRLARHLSEAASLNRTRVVALLPDPNLADTNQLPLLQGVLQRVGEDLRARPSATAQRVRVVPLVELRQERVRTAEEARRLFLADEIITAGLVAETNQWRMRLERLEIGRPTPQEAVVITAARGELSRLPGRVAAQTALWAGLRASTDLPSIGNPVAGADADTAMRLFLRGLSFLGESLEPAEGAPHAISALTEAIRLDPSMAEAFASLAEAHAWNFERSRADGDLREGFRATATALASTGAELPSAHYALGLLQLHLGDDEAAARAFRRAVELDRNHVGARRLLARALLRMGKAAEAETALREAVVLEPDNWRGYNSLGWFYRQQTGGQSRAETAFRRVVELAPQNHLGWANLGGFLLELGRDDEAREALNRSIQLRPTAPACSNLGSAEYFSGRFPEAARHYRQAAQLEPNEVDIQANLADAEWHVPDGRDRALQAYRLTADLARRSLAVNPDQPSIETLLATALARLGDWESALSIARRLVVRTDLDPDALSSLAITFAETGEGTEARRALERALKAGYSQRLAERHPDLAPLRGPPARGR